LPRVSSLLIKLPNLANVYTPNALNVTFNNTDLKVSAQELDLVFMVLTMSL